MKNLRQISRHVFKSQILSIRKCSNLTNSFKEVKIPVPWGHIAGKWWGPTDKHPILALHGWLVQTLHNKSNIFYKNTLI